MGDKKQIDKEYESARLHFKNYRLYEVIWRLAQDKITNEEKEKIIVELTDINKDEKYERGYMRTNMTVEFVNKLKELYDG